MTAAPENALGDSWRREPKVRAWEERLRAAGWTLESLRARDLLARGNGSLLFALAEARGSDPEGRPMLPYVLLRGAAVVVVPVCRNRATGERRFLMIRQRRVGSGDASLEFPAGMVDEPPFDPAGTAARELEEETGLRVDPGALVPLWDRDLHSSPGLSDESISFYAAEVELDAKEYEALEGGAAGHAHEGEFITTTVKTFAEAAAEITSVQPLLGFLLHRLRYGEIA